MYANAVESKLEEGFVNIFLSFLFLFLFLVIFNFLLE